MQFGLGILLFDFVEKVEYDEKIKFLIMFIRIIT